MTKPLIIGNWKMQFSLAESIKLINDLKNLLLDYEGKVEIVVCPSYLHLYEVLKNLPGYIKLGAQDLYFEDKGAFTGAVSGRQIKDIGCSYVILGHSERRRVFGENNEEINKKLKAALRNKLTPILCIGESLRERKNNQTEEVLTEQITKGFEGLGAKKAGKVVIAYEPVWAISGGDLNHQAATVQEAEKSHKIIRKVLSNLYSKELAKEMVILYGGSLRSENAEELLEQKNINGGLIGGASLQAEDFVKIIRIAERVKK